ncbi:RfbX [Actinomyces sp. oral taxon 414]|uniref:lipopolysaccharide biosynthesis protein n=1 Tax=Actinomyces sp. oral taxon 414 TaxID=712122 RepID=UPI0006AE8A13|nr:oligosaccharide flippase family protein [Actinomyces sp. oral taxon 414]ALC99740.1 RfbX [Actinomyces sp. oral taxon 414]
MDSSPFLRHVLTLMTGTAVAQGVTFVMMIVLARIYTPRDMGLLATYVSVASILVAVAALRYDMAIMLPRKELEALSVARLGMVCLTAVSLLATAASLPLSGLIERQWGHEVALWMPLVGLTTFLMSAVELFKYWFNRNSDYRAIAVNQAEQQIGLTSGQLVLGMAGMGGMAGLILGHTAGQIFAFVNLGRQAKPLWRRLPQGAPSLRWAARRYRRMPLLNGPNALADALRTNGIQLLIGGYSVASLGQFQMAWRYLDAPLILINGAVARVFFQKLSTIEPGRMRPLVRVTIKRAILIGLVPFALIYVLSPWIFPFFLGSQWTESGSFARALTPWLFMMLITSPISNLFIVTEHQDWMLGFALVYTAVPLAWLHWSPLALLPTCYILGAIMAGLLVANTMLADHAAKEFDAGKRVGGFQAQEN